MTSESPYLNTTEAAALIRVDREWVARQCSAGNLPATKLGKEWRIHRDALALFMSSGTTTPTPRPLRRRAS